MNEKLYSPGEAAKICNVHYTTVYNWIKDGILRDRQTPGGHHKILESDLIDFLKKYGYEIPKSLGANAKKVLVAEDDLPTRRLMVRLVKQSVPNCTIIEAVTGYEAGFMTRDLGPDLVVLDLVLPGIHGARVCRIIRRTKGIKNTKILAVTGHHHGGKAKRVMMKAGANAFLEKPFKNQEFIETICGLVGNEGKKELSRV